MSPIYRDDNIKDTMTHWFISVDGGGTKCTVRLEDESGQLIGREVAGAANIRLSVEKTWAEIRYAIEKILSSHGISLSDQDRQFHAAMGIAGCEIKSAYDRFMNTSHPFKTLFVTSDAEIACLGAHGVQDGAILIVGTGVVGFKKIKQDITKLSGYGFPHDDRGGGAYLGLEAVHHALCVKDGIMTKSMLSDHIHARFNHNWMSLVEWANHANATAFATLAPLVIQCAHEGDPQSKILMQQAAAYCHKLMTILLPEKNIPFALIGGIADAIKPYLHDSWQKMIRPALMLPEEGAMILLRQKVVTL